MLESANSRLRDLDLNNNDLWDHGIKVLSSAMSHPNCKLETLRYELFTHGTLHLVLDCQYWTKILVMQIQLCANVEGRSNGQNGKKTKR